MMKDLLSLMKLYLCPSTHSFLKLLKLSWVQHKNHYTAYKSITMYVE